MTTEDFNYDLPEDLIAQVPLAKRDESKLLVMNRFTGAIKHTNFKSIIDYLHEGDVLVLNDTRVLPARIIGIKKETQASIELLLLKDLGDNCWECLSRPFKRLHLGTIITFSDELDAKVIEKKEEGIVIVEFIYQGIFLNILDRLGSMPLPPYIKEKLGDKDRYQTVYAKNNGSAAAPTAGLHFTNELLEEIKKRGIIITYITLHVGLGTFRPVEVTDVTQHHMHSEYYEINQDTADILNKAKEEKRRIIACGTTTTRVLETVKMNNDKFIAAIGNTEIFIYPGFEFKAIDALITNFHLPKSTLVMLVSALSKKEFILNAYAKAIENNYRFFSFGDAMFINNEEV